VSASALLAAFLASRSDTDRAALIEAHRPLVENTARGFLRRLPPQVELEELESAGHLGLIRAVDSYDPAKGASLETWAIRSIRAAICDELRSRRGPGVELISLEAADHLPDPGPDPFALALQGEQKRLLVAAIARLPERWRLVIEGRFYAGREYTDIGAELGVCGSRVKQIEGKALERLRKVLALDAPTFGVDEVLLGSFAGSV